MYLDFQSVNKAFERSFRDNWTRPAMSNYQGDSLTYAQVCERILLLHIIFRQHGLQSGDKIAICGKNQTGWAVGFLAALSYGAVPVPLLAEFNAENIKFLLGHSDSRMAFFDGTVWDKIDRDAILPSLEAVVNISDLDILHSSRGSIEEARAAAAAEFGAKYPSGVTPDDVVFREDSPEELAMINYTSGTSGFSKGVMVPYRAVWANISFSLGAEPQMDCTSEIVSLLPLAHMYGMMFEFLHTMYIGAHVYFLGKLPSPRIILSAFQGLRPDLIIAVPLIIEKVYRNTLKPVAEKYKVALKIPIVGAIVAHRILKKVDEAFGGRYEEIILGGAPLNPDVEKFLRRIRFRFTVGYGMTECAPIITYDHWNRTRSGSCGKVVPGCQVKIDSLAESLIPGEILVKGDNVFLGYYKNEDATRECFTPDGWFRTGDMGVLRRGRLYLRGRSKCMILSANGQNIYPEELEAVINSADYVTESLVVDDAGALTAIIYPDYAAAAAAGMDKDAVCAHLEAQLPALNRKLPAYAQLRKLEFLDQDFARTPKHSIRRYLYQKK